MLLKKCRNAIKFLFLAIIIIPYELHATASEHNPWMNGII